MKQIASSKPYRSPYLQPSAVIMLFFGFSAGIPILLIFSSLSLWLREAGIERATVTMFGWAALGYSFKFIWSPLIDTLPIPFLSQKLGRRRAWILLSQMAVMVAICLMAFTNPALPDTLLLMAAAAVLLGFASATQDIVIDAYRIESASLDMQSTLAAMYTAGYRLGMIVAGAGALYLADFFGSTQDAYHYLAWKNTYLIMAAVMVVGVLTTLTAPESSATLDNNARQKQNHTLKIMKWYALIALVPIGGYGLLYLGFNLLAKLFGLPIALPASLGHNVLMYALLMGGISPIALIWLITRQPVITPLAISQTHNTNHSRLVITFVVAVAAFIAGFVQMGNVLPSVDSVLTSFFMGSVLPIVDSVLISFLLEVVRFMVASFAAFIAARILIAIKVVDKQQVNQAWLAPISDFFARYGNKALLLLALIGLYRVSDIVVGVISNVFYQDMGFSKTDIANAVKLVGVIMTIAGGFLGGWLALRMDIIKAMMVGAVLACSTNLLFIVLSHNAGNLSFLYMAVTLDNLAAGLASSIFIAFLSALTSIRFTAVQYALFSSLMTLFPKVLGGYSGAIVDQLDYPAFFMITFLLGLPVLYLVYLVGKHLDLSNHNPSNQNLSNHKLSNQNQDKQQ